MSKHQKTFLPLLILFFLLSGVFLSLPTVGRAEGRDSIIVTAFSPEKKFGKFAERIGYSQSPENKDPEYYAGVIINLVFSLLGVIAIALIVFNGFKWMTAQGNENQVKEARKGIVNSVLGLLIILASYAVTFFIFNIFT